MSQVVTEIYDGKINMKHRVVVNYKNTYRPIFWFQVSHDGSIYCSHSKSIKNVKEIIKGSKPVGKDGIFKLTYDEIDFDGDRVDIAHLQSLRSSFHGTGEVHLLNECLYRNSICDITQQENLCIVLFMHPEEFDEICIDNLRKSDVVLRMELSDDYPLVLNIFISESQYTIINSYQNEKNDTLNMLFKYVGIKGVNNLDLQLSFGMPSQAEWSKYNILCTR